MIKQKNVKTNVKILNFLKVMTIVSQGLVKAFEFAAI